MPPNVRRASPLVLALGAAAVLVVSIAILSALIVPAPQPNLISSPTSGAPAASRTPTASSSLPRLKMPTTRGSPPGQYGWEGQGPGAITGMHYVVESDVPSENREATVMGFAVGPDCLVTWTEAWTARTPTTPAGNPEPERVEIGDLAGVSIEPYEPTFQFSSFGSTTSTTRAYALDVGDTTLCVLLTWHPTTTEAELASAEATVQSLRAEPYGEGGVRIVFDLFDKWDTG